MKPYLIVAILNLFVMAFLFSRFDIAMSYDHVMFCISLVGFTIAVTFAISIASLNDTDERCVRRMLTILRPLLRSQHFSFYLPDDTTPNQFIQFLDFMSVGAEIKVALTSMDAVCRNPDFCELMVERQTFDSIEDACIALKFGCEVVCQIGQSMPLPELSSESCDCG